MQATISMIPADDAASHFSDLGGLLYDCVHAGANIGFVLPFTRDDAEAFWRENVLPAVRGGDRDLFIAQLDERIAGSVQLDTGTPSNQPHRAEVTKLLVHPEFRRRGVARALMAELECLAQQRGRSLITFDTRTGDSAEPLYASLGYQTAGVIPNYCLDPIEDRFYPTTVMYKVL